MPVMTTTEKDGYDTHVARTDNPHQVDKADVGLSNADNTSDAAKPISTATQSAIDGVQSNLDTHTAKGDADENHVGVLQLQALAASNTPSTSNPYATTADLVAGGQGEVNTASSQGAGSSLVLAKNIYDLPFKSLIGGNNIGITSQADTLTINQTVAQITDHTQLTSIGTNSHSEIDAHVALVPNHIDWTADQGSTNIDAGNYTDTTDHTQLSNIGTKSHLTIDGHIDTNNIHIDWTSDQGATNIDAGNYTNTTDHTQLSNIGSNTHTVIDTHLGSSANPHNVTAAQASAVANAPLETGEVALVKAVSMTKTAYDALPSRVATTLYIISGP